MCSAMSTRIKTGSDALNQIRGFMVLIADRRTALTQGALQTTLQRGCQGPGNRGSLKYPVKGRAELRPRPFAGLSADKIDPLHDIMKMTSTAN